ncbi:MAG: CaiB/BaiF CoA transferase family protein [Solirubrobacterales bacterium]
MTLPLNGIKVLDLTRYLAGPFCTQFLADFGAEVIKIEEPGGELGRLMQPVVNGESACFPGVNRNKKSLTLNLKAPEGKEIFRKLAANADIVMEQFRPGVMKKLGLDYESLRSVNPRLIYCSLTSYGQTGPLADRPAHDINFLSLAGVTGLTGTDQGMPALSAAQTGAITGGTMNAVIAVMMALFHRERTGQGQYIDVSMLDGSIQLLVYIMGCWFGNGVLPERGGDTFTGGMAFYNVYPTSDGRYFTLAALEERFWAHFCNTLGRSQYVPHQWTPGMQQEMIADIRSVTAGRTLNEWVALFADSDPCLTPVLTLEEMTRHPQVVAREMVHRIAGFHGTDRDLVVTGVPFKMSESPGQVKLQFPQSGEHNEDVLTELGYSSTDVSKLKRDGVI